MKYLFTLPDKFKDRDINVVPLDCPDFYQLSTLKGTGYKRKKDIYNKLSSINLTVKGNKATFRYYRFTTYNRCTKGNKKTYIKETHKVLSEHSYNIRINKENGLYVFVGYSNDNNRVISRSLIDYVEVKYKKRRN